MSTHEIDGSGDQLVDADLKVDRRELVEVARRIAKRWKDLALLLSPELFTVEKITQIQSRYGRLFLRAQVVIELWCGQYHRRATRRLLIQALCNMSERGDRGIWGRSSAVCSAHRISYSVAVKIF